MLLAHTSFSAPLCAGAVPLYLFLFLASLLSLGGVVRWCAVWRCTSFSLGGGSYLFHHTFSVSLSRWCVRWCAVYRYVYRYGYRYVVLVFPPLLSPLLSI